jgi:predicted alpha/beta hydrolase family esterase
VTIDSYGGNPDIVATREEIHRVAFEIKLAAEQLAAFSSIESLLSDPLRQLQYRAGTINVLSKLERLHSNCLVASEQYFSTEAQIHRRFEIHLVPALAAVATNVAAAFGWKLDHSVSATKTSTAATSTPNSITQLLDRLTQVSSKGQPTVGVDFFQTAEDQRTAIVYIPGTQTLGLRDGSNPLDLQSNILAMQGNGLAASERAVLEAMNQAGIAETDQVIFVGHSQGGMVAGNLAQHHAGYITAGLVTIGAPIAQLKLSKVPVMAIEHVNDPIPNASGRVNPISKNWVTIQRTSLASESDAPMHSHSLKSYKNTTQQLDASKVKGIVNIKQQLLSKLQGAPIGKAMDFVISREF